MSLNINKVFQLKYMFQRKPRRFRRRSNGRGHGPRINGDNHGRMRQNSFSNNQPRNNFRSTQSAEKLFEKYSALAKEALSSGDKTLSENYYQHADHFMRIIQDKNKNQTQPQPQPQPQNKPFEKPVEEDKNTTQETTIEKK